MVVVVTPRDSNTCDSREQSAMSDWAITSVRWSLGRRHRSRALLAGYQLAPSSSATCS